MKRFAVLFNQVECKWADNESDWDTIIPIINDFARRAKKGDEMAIICLEDEE